MTEEIDHIDKLLQNKLNDFQVESSPEDFAKFQKKLSGFRFFKFHWNTLNLYYIIAILGVAVVCFNLPENSANQIDNSQISNKKVEKQNTIVNKIPKTIKETRTSHSDNTNKQVSAPKEEKHNNPRQASNDDSFKDKSQENNNSTDQSSTPPDFGTKSSEVDSTEISSAAQNTQTTPKVIVYDTISTKKKVIVYDTVKTVIKKPAKPGKKRNRRNRKNR